MIRSFRHKGLAKYYETGSKAGVAPEQVKLLRLYLPLWITHVNREI